MLEHLPVRHSNRKPILAAFVSPFRDRSFVAVAAFIGFLHLLGLGTLLFIIAPEHLAVGTKAFGIGTGLTAYMLGIRHAFDADHIAAIDNTTRKLFRQGQRPKAVGFWFSCGHSTIVFVLTFLLAFGVHSVATPVLEQDSTFHLIAGYAGTIISGSFLYLIAALNLVVLREIWIAYRHVQAGRAVPFDIEAKLARRGFVNSLLHRVMRFVSKPWQMYLVGVLFGLGFDTATEISLLVLTGSGAASGLPWYATLCLPVLFAAGMSLMDTIDSSFMNAAYGWAEYKPAGKLYYNLVVTGLSVAAAFFIGSIEFMELASENFGLHGWGWSAVSTIDLNSVGFMLTGLFVVTWLLALVTRRITGARKPALEQ